jgi:hypothetical protein
MTGYFKIVENFIVGFSNIPFEDDGKGLIIEKEVTQEEFEGGSSLFVYKNGGVYNKTQKEFDNEKHINDLRYEALDIQQWLTENDWKVNKVFLGEWEETDARWLQYLKEREVKRTRLDEITEELEDNGL